MRSHATIAALVGAALLWAATAVAQVTPTTARVMKGTLTDSTVPSTNVPGPVAITYYLPKDYDAKRAEPYPLLIQLHGGGGSNLAMESLPFSPGVGGMGTLLDQAVEKTMVPPMVSVMPSAGNSFYMNFRDGSQKWEDFVMKDLLPYMRKNFNVVQGREGTFITGARWAAWVRCAWRLSIRKSSRPSQARSPDPGLGSPMTSSPFATN